jgi:hypothetical protein
LIDADPDPNFVVVADPHGDPTPSFTQIGRSEFFYFCHGIARLECFIFLISTYQVCTIFLIFLTACSNFREKS